MDQNFMYIETSSKSHDKDVYVILERTDNLQIKNISFNHNRHSIITNDSLKSRGRFRIMLLLEDNTWSTRYTIDKNTINSSNSTEWSLLKSDFTKPN